MKTWFKCLLTTGKVDPSAKAKGNQTPLHHPARNGHDAVVKYLLATGKVDPDAKDTCGNAPLHYAARNGHENVVKYLLTTGKIDLGYYGGSGGWC